MKCPGFERLLDYCEGQMKGPEARAVAAHLAAGCRRCADDLAWYERVRAVAARDDSLEPPPWVLQRALRLFTSHAPPRRPGRFERLVAALVFDSQARPALSGVRLAEAGNRQLLYRAGRYSIDVQITFSETGVEVIGQVLCEGEYQFESAAGLPVEARRGGRAAGAAVTNAVGEFRLSALDYGEYDLAIQTGEGLVIVPGVPVVKSEE